MNPRRLARAQIEFLAAWLCTTVVVLCPAKAQETKRDKTGNWQSQLPAHVLDPNAIGSMSIGHPHDGFLFNGVPMPEGKQWIVALPKFAWGTDETIANLIHAIGVVNERFPDSPRVIIGSISREGGGPFKPHLSHQSGRDADVGFYYKPGYPSGGPGTRENLDLERTWALVRAFVTETDVDMILIDESIKLILEGYALGIGEDPVWVGDLFRGNGSRYSELIKHVPGHTAHMHVRFSSKVARERGRREYEQLVEQGHLKLPGTKLVYQVERGDTLIGIAKKHGISVDSLVRQNKLSSKVIRVGQKLQIEKPQHLRGAREAVVVPRRRLPRANFAPSAVTRAPSPAPTQNDN